MRIVWTIFLIHACKVDLNLPRNFLSSGSMGPDIMSDESEERQSGSGGTWIMYVKNKCMLSDRRSQVTFTTTSTSRSLLRCKVQK